jgi:hypothetical protein
MDIIEVKKNTLAALRSFFDFNLLWRMVKDAVKLPYAKTYMFLAFLFTVIFMILMFPYDIILRSSLKNLEKNMLRSIYISSMDFSLFHDIFMNNVYMVLPSGNEIVIRTADINISMLRLVFGKDVKGSFQFTGLRYNTDEVQMDLGLNGEIYLDYKNFDEPPRNGNYKIFLTSSTIKIGEMTLPDSLGGFPLSLPAIKIKSGYCDGDLANQKISINNMKIFGDINCAISGSIAMARSFMSSRLDLKLTADADSVVLKDYRDFLGKFVNDRNQIVLAIRGSISRPYIDFGRSGPGAAGIKAEHPAEKPFPMR